MTTKTAQFTPGPWVVRPDSTIESKDGVTIASFVDNEADMSIISAAPAMYEALKALHSVLDQRMPDGRTLNQHLSREVFECFYGPAIAARVAIAKAEGA